MTTARHTVRTLVLQQVCKRIERLFGPQGTACRHLRSVYRGPLRPMGAIKPCANVSDHGQRHAGVDEDSGAQDVIQRIAVTLQIADDWESLAVVDKWTELVEQIVYELSAWLPSGAGATAMRYVEDSPASTLFSKGASEAVWEIVFELTRAAEKRQDESAEQ